MDHALYLSLYSAVKALDDRSLSASSSYAHLEDLIGQGAPLNPPEEGFPNLIKPLVAAMLRHGERVHPHMNLLVEAGANPMLYGEFKDAMAQDEEPGDYLLRAMFRAQDKGMMMRDEAGQNPLHVLMQSDWESSPNAVSWMKDRYHPQWVNATDHQGRTPLVALWEHVSFRPGRFSDRVYARLWKETLALVAYGARLDAGAEERTETMAETIARCVERGVLVPPFAADLVGCARAMIDRKSLDVGTSEVQSASPRRRI